MASKYDLFVFEDKGRKIVMVWDTAENGVSQWRHWDKKRVWVVKDNRHLGKVRKKWKLLTRVPECIWRHQGPGAWIESV
jgi:hypothetical protein